MTMIVTRSQAADHLRIDDATAEADDLDLKIEAASAVVLDYLETAEADYLVSDELVFPEQLQAAVLLLVGDLHRYRDTAGPNYSGALLPPAVRALLYPLKTFGLAAE